MSRTINEIIRRIKYRENGQKEDAIEIAELSAEERIVFKKIEEKEETLIKSVKEVTGNKGEAICLSTSADYYHYTNLDGLHGIFSEYINMKKEGNIAADNVKVCTLRASQIRFLNDKSEYKEGKEQYEKIKNDLHNKIFDISTSLALGTANTIDSFDAFLKNYYKWNLDTKASDCLKYSASTGLDAIPPNFFKGINESFNKEEVEDIYSISFCAEGDIKSQWQLYGQDTQKNDCGISIKFNIGDIIFSHPRKDNDGRISAITIDPFPVCYTDSQKLELFLMACLKYNENGSGPNIGIPNAIDFIPYCKHISFREEKESRLLFFNENKGTIFSQYQVYYPNIKPTIDIQFELKKESKEHNIISEIIVGPGNNQNLIFNHLIHIFDNGFFKFYDDEEDNGAIISPKELEELKKGSYDGKTHIVKCKYGDSGEWITRVAYKCKNEIIIMKSSIPFRG